MADDYDNPWKEAIEGYFSDFLHFYFPQAHAQIDWSQPHCFLDQELRSVVRDAELGRRFVDKLVRVSLQHGQTEWIYVHVEVQGTLQREFAERMFVYHYRLYDRYRRPVASLALLTDDQPDWRPERYVHEACGCSVQLRFPVAKLLDWSGSEALLEDHQNPFALVTQAHLATRATRYDVAARRTAKWSLVQRMYRRGWDRQKVIDLFKVLDWMMQLPADLDQQLRSDLTVFEEEAKMPYVSSIERIAIQEGMAKGMQQGRIEGKLQTLSRLLVRRYGELPAWSLQRLNAATEADIETWTDNLLSSDSLESVLGTNHP